MAKQNFTPAGVQAKMAELYALTDSLLAEQAAAMRADFKSWFTTNFTLDTAQTAYLNAMDSRFLTAAGDEVALATTGRLEVELVAPTPPGLTAVSTLPIVIRHQSRHTIRLMVIA